MDTVRLLYKWQLSRLVLISKTSCKCLLLTMLEQLYKERGAADLPSKLTFNICHFSVRYSKAIMYKESLFNFQIKSLMYKSMKTLLQRETNLTQSFLVKLEFCCYFCIVLVTKYMTFRHCTYK